MWTRVLGVGCALLLLIASAHSGLYTLAWEERWGAYTVTVLEDFHLRLGSTDRGGAAERGQAQLLVQLSEGRQAAPRTTQVEATIRHTNATLYRGTVPHLVESSADGQASYRSYFLDVPLSRAGVYQLELTLSGPLGTERRRYTVRSRRSGPSPLEYLPSVLILVIVLGGAALLFVPVEPTRDLNDNLRKDDDEDSLARPSPHA